MRILVVEDDPALGALLVKRMRLEGNAVHLVGDGEQAVAYALEHMPDLMVLDLSLPRKDGMQVLEELSGKLRETSILVLTGRHDVQERIRCLELGADDCMLKPFSVHELHARCKALLRRHETFADPVLRQGPLELNRLDRKVTRSGRRLELTAKEFALLEFLMQARGRTCSRSELLQKVWQMSPDAGTNVVDVYVNYLRKKLGAAAPGDGERGGEAAGELIETVRGEGYLLGMGTMRRLPVKARAEDLFRGSLVEPKSAMAENAMAAGMRGVYRA